MESLRVAAPLAALALAQENILKYVLLAKPDRLDGEWRGDAGVRGGAQDIDPDDGAKEVAPEHGMQQSHNLITFAAYTYLSVIDACSRMCSPFLGAGASVVPII